jgi:hypothetical protein
MAVEGYDRVLDVVDDELVGDVLPDDDVARGTEGPAVIDEDGEDIFQRASQCVCICIVVVRSNDILCTLDHPMPLSMIVSKQ